MLASRSDSLRVRLKTIVKRKLHVAVIGAGAFGGWIALYLLRRGAKVTLVDAGDRVIPEPPQAAKRESSAVPTDPISPTPRWRPAP